MKKGVYKWWDRIVLFITWMAEMVIMVSAIAHGYWWAVIIWLIGSILHVMVLSPKRRAFREEMDTRSLVKEMRESNERMADLLRYIKESEEGSED